MWLPATRLERLIDYIGGREGVRFVDMQTMATDFRERYPYDSDERPPMW